MSNFECILIWLYIKMLLSLSFHIYVHMYVYECLIV